MKPIKGSVSMKDCSELLDYANIGYVLCELKKENEIIKCPIIEYNQIFMQFFGQGQHMESDLIQLLINIKTISPDFLAECETKLSKKEGFSSFVYSLQLKQWMQLEVAYLENNRVIVYAKPIPSSFVPSDKLSKAQLFNNNYIEEINNVLLAMNELLINSFAEENLFKGLGLTGQAFVIDKITMFKLTDNTVNKLTEWKNDKYPVDDKELNYDNDVIQVLKEELKHKPYFCSTESKRDILTRFFTDLQIKASTIIPIIVKNSLWGFLQLDDYKLERIWLDDELYLLQLLTSTISKEIERKLTEQEVENLSYRDSLTGLYNRRYFEICFKNLDTEINLPISIIVGDVNGLKLVNDAFGHTSGDDLLKEAAKVILDECSDNDIIARWGGDEFIFLLPNTSLTEAHNLINRIKEKGKKTIVHSIPISISFGVDTKENPDTELDKTLKKAEDVMYQQKLIESAVIKKQNINSIMKALYELAPLEEEHANRVSELCAQIGLARNFDQYGIRYLRTIGLYHDIGKIGIDKELLNKSDSLTKEEWKEMKRHCEIGYRILSTSTEMAEIADCVLHHHEFINGEGYPNGLIGDEIPIMTRILSVAEAYDEMSSPRPYKKIMSEEEIIAELINNSATQFDHNIVRTFVEKVLRKPWYSVIRGANNTVITLGQNFDPLHGVSIHDSNDENLSIKDLQIIGSVDVNKTGNYSIIYSITNKYGQTERLLRKVSVGILREILSPDLNAFHKIQIEGSDFSYENEDETIKIRLIKGGRNVWSAQLVYPHLNLVKGKEYVLSFEAFSNQCRKEMHISIGWNDFENNYWHSFLSTVDNKYYLSKSPQTYKLMFKMNNDSRVNSDLKFEFGTGENSEIGIKNIHVYEYIK